MLKEDILSILPQNFEFCYSPAHIEELHTQDRKGQEKFNEEKEKLLTCISEMYLELQSVQIRFTF